ncbi:hypothetical protein G6F31_017350 [Rhizopus arrhizus]|nr:hypothetical protein G6F31_017350 [Rhizopus arrhizus]
MTAGDAQRQAGGAGPRQDLARPGLTVGAVLCDRHIRVVHPEAPYRIRPRGQQVAAGAKVRRVRQAQLIQRRHDVLVAAHARRVIRGAGPIGGRHVQVERHRARQGRVLVVLVIDAQQVVISRDCQDGAAAAGRGLHACQESPELVVSIAQRVEGVGKAIPGFEVRLARHVV